MAQNRQGRDDLRVRRTRKMLQEAMIALTIEQGFASLTVRKIAERAMVNRATFYRHYLDKYDLLDQYMEEYYLRLFVGDVVVSPTGEISDIKSKPPSGLVRMFEHVREHARFFRAMLGKNGDPSFARKIREYIEKRMRSQLPEQAKSGHPGGPPLDLTMTYLSSAGVGALAWWLENDFPCTPEQLASWMVQFSYADLSVSSGRISST